MLPTSIGIFNQSEGTAPPPPPPLPQYTLIFDEPLTTDYDLKFDELLDYDPNTGEPL
jgi:hypothetical protein